MHPKPKFLRLLALGALLAVAACTPGELQTAKDVLSVLNIACIIANAESGDATVAQACDIANTLLPDLRTILGEQRKAIAKAKRAGCAPHGSDAGAP